LEDHLAPQRSLRARFDDFRQALERRDRIAYQLALRDFQGALRRWTETEERVLLSALARTAIPGRDPQRELRLQYVQVRELTRYLLEQVSGSAPIGDILGLVENLERRLSAHEGEMERVYYPAALLVLTDAERRALRDGAPEA
jgi:hypothetical protein